MLQESRVASRRGALACCYICHLTIHSSRTRFVASFKRAVVRLHPLTDQHVAGRLNSGVMRGREHVLAGFFCRHSSSANGLPSRDSTAAFGQHHVAAARLSVSWSSRDVVRPGESFARSRNSPRVSSRPVIGGALGFGSLEHRRSLSWLRCSDYRLPIVCALRSHLPCRFACSTVTA